MYDANKVKTFTPIMPEGRGPTGLYSQDALYDILYALEENNSNESFPEEFDRLAEQMNKLLNLDDLIDGEYTLFMDYKIKIETMAKTRFDEMPEFNGY